MDPGKVDREFFADHIYSRLGATREDVRLGPAYGADFGVIDVADRVLAVATDPLWVLEELGLERAAWFAFHIAVSDVALSGLPPSHLSVDFNLPTDLDEEAFETIWSVFDREARALGTSVVTGHTGAYAGCQLPTVGGATALAVGDPADLVVPTGASPGDRVVVTKGPAIETAGLLATLFGHALDLPDAVVADAQARFADVSPVRDALTAAAAGPVTAMHDATERGLANGLHELAAASDVRLAVARDRVPVSAGVTEVCEAFGVDPWRSSSSGTVVAAVAPGGVEPVLAALDDEGVPAADVGEVQEGEGVTVDGEALSVPESDPLWDAYQRGLDRYGVAED